MLKETKKVHKHVPMEMTDVVVELAVEALIVVEVIVSVLMVASVTVVQQ